MSKLKPVVFVEGKYAYNAQNTTQQIMLLKALRITQDPKKLKELIGVKTVADVYRTLDKIAMRKEYHNALVKKGITFDYVVDNIKDEIDHAGKASDKLKALNMILKSVGLDKYEETAIGGGGWEDLVEDAREEKDEEQLMEEAVEYEVVPPEMPESVKKAKEKSNLETKELYD